MGVAIVDFMSNVNVKDGYGATKQVDVFKIMCVVPDIDDLVFHKLYEAYLVAPSKILLVQPSVPSVLRKERVREYESAVAFAGGQSIEESNARSVNRNAADTDARRINLFLLEFPEGMELEVKYFQTPSGDHRIFHSFADVPFKSELGLEHTNTILSYKVSVIPQEERLVVNAPNQRRSDMEILRDRLARTRIASPGGIPQQQQQAQPYSQPLYQHQGFTNQQPVHPQQHGVNQHSVDPQQAKVNQQPVHPQQQQQQPDTVGMH
jgi:hypothetical protein